MNERKAEGIALPVVEKVVNWLALKQYEKLPDLVVLDNEWTPALVKEFLEEFLEANEIDGVDPFGTPLTENLMNDKYQQMHIIPYRDGSGFHLDYDLTSKGGKWNDLTLQMSFKKDAGGNLIPYFMDLHVM